ncbi:MAG: PepSY domain-containing protein [Gammaproteobacteria bacterium]|nr:MAG: PepSY domain-containing protein [Gammaproteobacteria bacterium]
MEKLNAKQVYRTLWRWHFYAGIFAIPFVIILSITGAIYLFKPQIDALHDAPYRNLTIDGQAGTPEQQVAAAFTAVPNASFIAYELPREKTDAVNIILNKSGKNIRVYVHPQTLAILAVEEEDKRFLRIVHDLHGELLLGKFGSVLVELAACWAIVLVMTGIYLWWPRSAKGVAGILYPRVSLKGRLFWRDLHSVAGIWISFFVLFLLISGLPWALVWGSALKEVRGFTSAAMQQQDWSVAGQRNLPALEEEHAHHDMGSPVTATPTIDSSSATHHDHGAGMHGPAQVRVNLDLIVAHAQQLKLEHPVWVAPPSARTTQWTAKSNTQNRPRRADAYFSAQTGELIDIQNFSQRHLIDRAVGIGVSAHEGQLFGWFNQLLGLITALGLVLISVSGFIMWRKRAPDGVLGAPPAMPDAEVGKGFVVIIMVAAVVLPVLGISLIVILLIEKIIFSRWAYAKNWLGLHNS